MRKKVTDTEMASSHRKVFDLFEKARPPPIFDEEDFYVSRITVDYTSAVASCIVLGYNSPNTNNT